MQIKLTKWGTACRIGNIIYINEKIKNPLYEALLKHELNHSSKFNLKDIKMDLKIIELEGLRGEYYKFILKNPKTWIMFLPFWKYENKWVIDPSILGAWLVGIAFGGILWQLL
jgi:hypothetical protein